jgi:hypothetical protein|tara:strand:- start:551 stop:736 length:186 start_codon:yes stop_codon:yes gene_type:complete
MLFSNINLFSTGEKMETLKKEWSLFKKDFARQSSESFLFRFNWYVLKPLALVLVLIAFITL